MALTLDQFVESIKADAERFKSEWLARREANPDEHWPMSMGSGEWFDNFLMLDLKDRDASR